MPFSAFASPTPVAGLGVRPSSSAVCKSPTRRPRVPIVSAINLPPPSPASQPPSRTTVDLKPDEQEGLETTSSKVTSLPAELLDATEEDLTDTSAEKKESGPSPILGLTAAGLAVFGAVAVSQPDTVNRILLDPHFLVSLGLGASAFVQTLTGFGFAIVSVGALSQIPWIAHSSVFEDIQPIAATISTAIAWAIVAPRFREVEWRRLTPLIISSCITTPIGAVMLNYVNSGLVLKILGGLIAGYSVIGALNYQLPKAVGGKVGAWICGALAGLCGGAYDISSPPVVVHGQSAKWGDAFRLNIMGIACVNGIVLVLTDLLTGRLEDFYYWDLLKYALPAVVFALVLGSELSKMIDAKRFVKLVFARKAFLSPSEEVFMEGVICGSSVSVHWAVLIPDTFITLWGQPNVFETGCLSLGLGIRTQCATLWRVMAFVSEVLLAAADLLWGCRKEHTCMT